jgi:Mrp family chromosome partitioning ATPase
MDSIERALGKAKADKAEADKTKSRQAGANESNVIEAQTERDTDIEASVSPLAQVTVPSAISQVRAPSVQLDPKHLERHRIIAHSRDNPNSAAFHLLRTTLLQKMEAAGARAIGIVAPSPAVGKTVLAINLAMCIARLPESTALLVDMDLRSPKVTKYLGLDEGMGMTDFLQGQCDFESLMIYPQLSRFVVAPAGKPVLNSSELLASKKAVDFIKEAKTRYLDRVVIFDLPPLLYGDDTLAILPKLDGVLLALAHGVTTKEEIEVSKRHLESSNVLGTVLNKAPIGIEGATYGFGAD